VAGSLELRREHPDQSSRIALGEELSIRFDGHLFHLGLSGLPEDRLDETHASLRTSARLGQVDAVFDELRGLGCLVVLNHPLITWNGVTTEVPALGLLRRHGPVIDASSSTGCAR